MPVRPRPGTPFRKPRLVFPDRHIRHDRDVRIFDCFRPVNDFSRRLSDRQVAEREIGITLNVDDTCGSARMHVLDHDAVKIAGEMHASTVSFSGTDDGRGFDPEAAPGPKQGHFGLLGIRERIEDFNGTVEVKSFPGQGAKFTVTLNCREMQT